MVAVFMVETSIDKVILMIAMRHEFMPAAVVTASAIYRKTARRVSGGDRKGMLVVMAFVFGMKMSVVQVIHMVVMPKAGVSAIRRVNVRMIGVGRVAHGFSFGFSANNSQWKRLFLL